MEKLSPTDRKSYIVACITLVIMIGFRYLPTFGQVTTEGMTVLGVFLGCIFAWIFGEVVWSSILGLVLLVIYNYGTMIEIYASAYANNNVAIMLTSLVFCYSIEKSGLLAEISKWIVSQKWVQKSPWALVFAFFVAAVVSATLVGNFLTPLILLWALFYEFAKEIGVKPYEPYSCIILCGIAVSAGMGASMMPYTGLPTIIRGMAQAFDQGFVFNSGEYILINLLLAIVFIPLVVVILRLVFGRQLKNVQVPKREPYKMQLNSEGKISFAFLMVIILCLIIPNFLPDGNYFKVLFNERLSVPGLFMIGAAVLMIIRVKGEPVLDIVEALTKFPWSMLILVSSALCISEYITRDEMGIVPTIVAFLEPLMAGKSAFAVTMIFMALGLIMTNFINDVVTLMMLFPIAAQFIVSVDGSYMLLALLFSQATVQGCLMPSGSILGAMLHGNPRCHAPWQQRMATLQRRYHLCRRHGNRRVVGTDDRHINW